MSRFDPDSTPATVYNSIKTRHFSMWRHLNESQKTILLCSQCGLIAVVELTQDMPYLTELSKYHARNPDLDLMWALTAPGDAA